MLNFSCASPTRIYFGQEQIASIKRVIPSDSAVMITCGGGSITANDIYDEVIASLDANHVSEFPGIEPNPSYETAVRVRHLHNEHEDQRIEQAIGNTVEFFHRVNMPTRLSHCSLGAEVIEPVCQQLQRRGYTTLGKRKQVTLDEVADILRAAI